MLDEEIEPEEYCRRLSPRLIGALRLHCGNHELAEDLAQEALARTWERWSAVTSMAHPEAWTFRVAFNLAKSEQRRGRVFKRVRSRLGTSTSSTASSSKRLELAEALAKLTDRQREAVVLRYYAQFSIIETSRAMECAPGTVKSLCSQALKTLKVELGDAVSAIDDEGDLSCRP